MYKRSYNRGRRGMTFKMKPVKRSRFKSVTASPIGVSGESALNLQVLRVIAVIVAAVIVIGAIVLGVKFFAFNDSRKSSSQYSSDEINNAQLLRVVNKSNPLEKNYVPELVDKGGYRISALADKSLDKLLADAEKLNLGLYVKYAFVSYSQQKKIYTTEYNKQLKKGLTEVKAQAKTTPKYPQPGRSEFQTGLMVSFRSTEKGLFKNSKASDWLLKNAKKYGFVLRYPEGKEEITSMNANYKSYRYVGKENAKAMQSLNMCLNEYNYYINSRKK